MTIWMCLVCEGIQVDLISMELEMWETPGKC